MQPEWRLKLIVFSILLLLAVWSEPAHTTTDVVLRKATVDGVIRFSSPVFADLNGDGYDEILVGTTTGHLVALEYDGKKFGDVLWDTFLGASIGSSPAVADVNADGFLEVVVGVGYNPPSQPGSIVLLNHEGVIQWRKTTGDRNGGADGVPDGVFATPALEDLNQDGYLEIVVAGYDENLYVLNHQGADLPGWPFHMRDNTWGSAALADLNHDGYVDIIVGGYRHEDGCPDAGCGRLFAFDHTGVSLKGWPLDVPTHLDSSPSVGDIDSDGSLEIVIGSGQNTDARFYKVYAFEADGTVVNGWPRPTNGYVFSSPSLADINGDGTLEIFVGARDGKLYGWRHDGTSLPNWPVTPLNQNGESQPIHASSPVIVDVDGDRKLEIFIVSGWDIVGFERDGSPLANRYRFHTDYEIGSTPAFGDPDHDGYLELGIGSSDYRNPESGTVYLWDLHQGANLDIPAWSMWRRDPQRSGRATPHILIQVHPESVYLLHDVENIEDRYFSVTVENSGTDAVDCEVLELPVGTELVSGCTSFTDQVEIVIKVPTTYLQTLGRGYHDLGVVKIATTPEGQAEPTSLKEVPVGLYIGDLYLNFLPLAGSGM